MFDLGLVPQPSVNISLEYCTTPISNRRRNGCSATLHARQHMTSGPMVALSFIRCVHHRGVSLVGLGLLGCSRRAGGRTSYKSVQQVLQRGDRACVDRTCRRPPAARIDMRRRIRVQRKTPRLTASKAQPDICVIDCAASCDRLMG